MKPLILAIIAVAAFAAPQGYTLNEPSEPGLSVSREYSASGISTQEINVVGIDVAAGGSEGSLGSNVAISEDIGVESATSATGVSTGSNIVIEDSASECPEGQVLHVDGTCVTPKIVRKIFLFSVPKQEQQRSDPVSLSPPKVEHNILFVRLPKGGVGPEPIVVPPPKQESIIYVLSKQSQQGQRVIEVPAPPPSEPEIYFVNYEKGENPELPGGLDLHTALGSAATASGQVLGHTSDHDSRVVEVDSNNGGTDAGVHFDGGAISGAVEPQTNVGVAIVENSGTGGISENGQEITSSYSPPGLYTTP